MQKGSEICLKPQAGFSAREVWNKCPQKELFGPSHCALLGVMVDHPVLGLPILCPHILVWGVGMWHQGR